VVLLSEFIDVGLPVEPESSFADEYEPRRFRVLASTEPDVNRAGGEDRLVDIEVAHSSRVVLVFPRKLASQLLCESVTDRVGVSRALAFDEFDGWGVRSACCQCDVQSSVLWVWSVGEW